MDQQQYQHGNFALYITTRNFTLGHTVNGQPLALTKGTDVLFDGTTAEVAGARYPIPQLRGAIRTGWLVKAENYDENDRSAERPRAAGIQVRHAADGGNPLKPNQSDFHRATEEDIDEREVGNVDSHARTTRDRNVNHRSGSRPRDTGLVPGQRFEGSTFQVEAQDGVEVRSGFATAASAGEDARKIPATQLTRAGEAISRANNVQIQAGVGITEEEMLDRMPHREREAYLQEKEMYRSRYADMAPSRTIRVDDSSRRVVGRTASHGTETREGFSTRLTTGGGTETADLAGLDSAPARRGVIDSEGLTFRTTNGPERDVRTLVTSPPEPVSFDQSPRVVRTVSPAVSVKEAPAEIRKMVAKQMCADFPDNYDFTSTPRKRLARLQADYEGRSDVLRAVFAAEGDEMKEMLLNEFPSAFQQS